MAGFVWLQLTIVHQEKCWDSLDQSQENYSGIDRGRVGILRVGVYSDHIQALKHVFGPNVINVQSENTPDMFIHVGLRIGWDTTRAN